MITEQQAKKIALDAMPENSKFIKSTAHENQYIFMITWSDPLEGDLDPFYSVDKTTGEFRDFDIETGGPNLIRQFTS